MPRGGVNYIPRPDAVFDGFAGHYYDAVKNWWSVHGLDLAELNPLYDALVAWREAFPAHVAAAAAAESARQAKDAARRALEARIRPTANFVQSYPTTTDADRAEIGITVRGERSIGEAGPRSRPLVSVDTSLRLMHTLRFSDESTPTRRGKPPGVLGAEVWVRLIDPAALANAIAGFANVPDAPSSAFAGLASVPAARAGAPGGPAGALAVPAGASAASAVARAALAGGPAGATLGDPAALTYLTLCTRTPCVAEFKASDGGKTAVYVLRWVGTRGQKGPWSEVCSATVAA